MQGNQTKKYTWFPNASERDLLGILQFQIKTSILIPFPEIKTNLLYKICETLQVSLGWIENYILQTPTFGLLVCCLYTKSRSRL